MVVWHITGADKPTPRLAPRGGPAEVAGEFGLKFQYQVCGGGGRVCHGLWDGDASGKAG